MRTWDIHTEGDFEKKARELAAGISVEYDGNGWNLLSKELDILLPENNKMRKKMPTGSFRYNLFFGLFLFITAILLFVRNNGEKTSEGRVKKKAFHFIVSPKMNREKRDPNPAEKTQTAPSKRMQQPLEKEPQDKPLDTVFRAPSNAEDTVFIFW